MATLDIRTKSGHGKIIRAFSKNLKKKTPRKAKIARKDFSDQLNPDPDDPGSDLLDSITVMADVENEDLDYLIENVLEALKKNKTVTKLDFSNVVLSEKSLKKLQEFLKRDNAEKNALNVIILNDENKNSSKSIGKLLDKNKSKGDQENNSQESLVTPKAEQTIFSSLPSSFEGIKSLTIESAIKKYRSPDKKDTIINEHEINFMAEKLESISNAEIKKLTQRVSDMENAIKNMADVPKGLKGKELELARDRIQENSSKMKDYNERYHRILTVELPACKKFLENIQHEKKLLLGEWGKGSEAKQRIDVNKIAQGLTHLKEDYDKSKFITLFRRSTRTKEIKLMETIGSEVSKNQDIPANERFLILLGSINFLLDKLETEERVINKKSALGKILMDKKSEILKKLPHEDDASYEAQINKKAREAAIHFLETPQLKGKIDKELYKEMTKGAVLRSKRLRGE